MAIKNVYKILINKSYILFLILMLLFNGCFKNNLSLSTQNFKMKLCKDGRILSLRVREKDLETSNGVVNSGFYIIEYPDKETVRVGGDFSRRGRLITLRSNMEDDQLSFNARYEQREDYILITGEIEDLSGSDRGLDVTYRLPVSAIGWKWWDNIIKKKYIESDSTYTNLTEMCKSDIFLKSRYKPCELISKYPVGCVTNEEEDAGIAIAVSAHHPCVHRIEYNSEKEVLLICFRLGLTPDAKPKLKSKVPFGFLIYSVDSKWGFRDALAKYYRIYSEIFERRAKKDGILLEQRFADEKKNNPNWTPDYFAYSKNPTEDDLAREESLGIDSYEYVLPGHGGKVNKSPETLPGDYEEAMRMYRNYKVESDNDYLKRWVKLGSLRYKNGNYIMRIGVGWFKFPVNPDPDLGDKSRTSYLLDYAGRTLSDHPAYDGIYSDSFHGWGVYCNYRREHFKYADIPLTHDEEGDVYLWNTLSHREWLLKLKEHIEPYGGLVMGNGIRPGQMWTSFLLDQLKVESKDIEHYPWDRAMAYHKPFHISSNIWKGGVKVETILKNCTLYGLLPSRMSRNRGRSYDKQDEDLIDLYVPVIIKESSLGWEPVTNAVSSDPAIQVERFGPKNESLIFAIFNKENRSKSITLNIDTQALGIEMNSVKSLISKRDIPAKSSINLDLEANEIEVIQIGKSFSWESCL